MRKSLALAAVVASVALVPSLAAAQPTTAPTIYCSATVPGGCFAMAWAFHPDLSATMWIQNLQGSYGGGTEVYGIDGGGIWRWETSDALMSLGAAMWTTEGAVQRSTVLSLESTSGDEFSTFYFEPAPAPGMVGCTEPPHDDEMTFHERTCLPEGLDGWHRFDFASAFLMDWRGEVIRPLTRHDLAIRIGDCGIVGSLSGLTQAETGPLCTSAPYSALHTVPEPSTWALMGTGLLGLGGVVVRRRRKDAR